MKSIVYSLSFVSTVSSCPPVEGGTSGSSSSSSGSDREETTSSADVVFEELDIGGDLELELGDIVDIDAFATFSDGSVEDYSDDVTWSSGDEDVFVVSSAGGVVAVGGGTATLTATHVDGSERVDVSVLAVELSVSQMISYSGGTIVTFVVENYGTLDAANVDIEVEARVDGVDLSEDASVDLDVGETYEYAFNLDEGGSWSIAVTADPDDAIPEGDEGDNFAEFAMSH